MTSTDGPLLDGIAIEGYRSFGDLQKIGPLRKINFFIGQNNSGKSNVLRYVHKRHFILKGSDQNGQFAPGDAHTGRSATARVFGFAMHLGCLDRFASDTAYQSKIDIMRGVFEAVQDGNGELAWFLWNEDRTTKESFRRRALQRKGERFWVHAAETLAGQYARGGGDDAIRRNMAFAIDMLGRIVAGPLAQVKTVYIPPFREVQKTGPEGEDGTTFNGANIIGLLNSHQSPDAADYIEKSKAFDVFQAFVREVTGFSDARVQVPASLKTLNIHIDGKVLPLENIGTGIHEVIMLAAAATVHQGKIICMEEPEIHLHPRLQRRLIEYLQNQTSNQYLIATHSVCMLEAPGTATFHVTHDGVQSSVSPAENPSDYSGICQDLGVRASALMQANCVIWVEGPSDRTYLQHWLAREAPSLIEGVDYSIMFYGGRLLAHLSASDVEVDEFISLRRLNRHVAIVIDSDRRTKGGRINATKGRVRDEIAKDGGFVWITKGKEIENYIPQDVIEKAIATIHPNTRHKKFASTEERQCYGALLDLSSGKTQKPADKVKVAREVVKSAPPMDAMDLAEQIRSLIRFIHTANDRRVAHP